MSIRSTKIAVSLPKTILQELEHLRHHLGLARSAAVSQAIDLWLHKKEDEDLEEKYLAGYKKKPEVFSDAEVLFQAGLSSFEPENW